MKSKMLLICFVILIIGCNPKKNASKKTKQVDSETLLTDTNTDTENGPSADISGDSNIINIPVDSTNNNILDPLVFEAWHLNNNGQKSFSSSSGVSGIDLNLQNTNKTGLGVWVAVSDNGVEKGHEDLKDNINLQLSKNYSLDTEGWIGDPTPSDSAHGTAVTGIIAAIKGNNKGSQGIAPRATIAAFKYLGTSFSTSKQVDQANGNYDVFNYSYGGYSCHFDHSSQIYISQLEYGVKNLRAGLGAIYIKSAGNEYYSHRSDCDASILKTEDKYYLGNANLEEVHSYPWTIVTGAINASGISASYSTPGSSLWISAPGGEFGVDSPAIITTDLSGCDKGLSRTSASRNDFENGNNLNLKCNYTSTMNGTSSSSPMITGTVALMLEANPNLTWRDVKYILAKTARKVDSDRVNMDHPGSNNLKGHIYDRGWISNAAGYSFHNWYGFGLVDASAAINMSQNYKGALGPLQSVNHKSEINLDLDIPDTSSNGIENTINVNSNLTIEAVQIKLNITHPWVGDIGIELTSPQGTTSTLMNINSGVSVANISNEVLLSNAFYGEKSSGVWSLKVIDGAAIDTGTLNQWSIKVYGN